MAKDKVYGFADEESFRRVRKATRKVLGERTRGSQRRRQVPVVSGTQLYLAKTTETVAAQSTGTFEFYSGPLGSETGTGRTGTAYNRGDEIPDGTWINVQPRGDGNEMYPIVCP